MSYIQQIAFEGNPLVTLRWGDFLTIVQNKNLSMQYITNADTTYTVFALDANIIYQCLLVPLAISAVWTQFLPDYTVTQNNIDVATFTGTYQATCNQAVGLYLSSSGSIAANTQTVIATTLGKSVVTFKVTGTWSGTLTLQASVDGTNWDSIQAYAPSSGNWTNATTSNLMMVVPCGGYKYVQLIATAWSSGTATISYNVSQGGNATQVFSSSAAAFSAQVQGTQAVGQALSGNNAPVMSGLNLGGNISTQTGTSVAGTVAENGIDAENLRTTYSASIRGLVPATTPTDIFTITGSASKVIRITHIEVSATMTSAGTVDLQLLTRSAANTGGTSTNPAATPHDASDAAATAVINAYTANPTGLGAAVGSPIRSQKFFIPGVGALFESQDWDFGIRNGKPLVLRTAAQVLALNLNSVTVTGGSFDISIEWTEDAV